MAETLEFPAGHVRLGSSAGQPITRRDGHLKVTGAGHVRRRQSSGWPALRGDRHQQHRPRPCHVPRCRRRQGPSGRGGGDHPGQPPAAGARSGREGPHAVVAHRGAAGRHRALRRPADRCGRRRDAGGRQRGRPPPRPALRRRAGADRSRPRRGVRAGSRRHRRRTVHDQGRRRGRVRGRRPPHPDRYRDAAAVPQRAGAARHRRRVGRRPADARRAEPGDRHRPQRLRRLLRRAGGERSPSQPLHRRRLRVQGDPQRAAAPVHPRRADGGAAGQAGAAARSDVRTRRPSRRHAPACDAGGGRGGPADGARAPRAVDHVDLRRLSRAGGQRIAQPLRHAGADDTPHRCARRHRHARPHARPRRGDGLGRPRVRDGRGGRGGRPRPAGVSPPQLCRDGSSDRPAVLLQGAAQVLRRGGEALRLGRAPARPAADARRCRPPRRLGHGDGPLPVADVPGPGHRCAAPGRDGHRRDIGRRDGSGRADGAGADRRRRSRPRRRQGRVPRRLLRVARRRRRRRLRPHRHGRQRDLRRRQRCDPEARGYCHRRSRLASLRRRQHRCHRPWRSPPPRRRREPQRVPTSTSCSAPVWHRWKAPAPGPATPPTRRTTPCSPTARSSPR